MDIVYPIQESLQISLNTIMLKVENTPYLKNVVGAIDCERYVKNIFKLT